MELRDYIEQAANKAGSVSALARMLGLNQPDVSNAKAMKKRLPNKAVVEIAEYIGADLKAVIAANELVTEKDEAKRAFWSPFVEHARAAAILVGLALVTNFVTPSPAQASSYLGQVNNLFVLCKVRRLKAYAKTWISRLYQQTARGLFYRLDTDGAAAA